MNPNDMLTHAMQAYQSGEEPERLYATAGTYWRGMLSVAVALCVLAAAGGAYMLVMTFFNLSIRHSQAGAPQNLNRAELSRVATGINDRKALFNSLQVGTSTIADPSR